MAGSRVNAENLSVRRADRLIFSGLSFVLKQGESLVFTGPNGAGKSTAIRAALGLLRPETGSACFEDEAGRHPLAAASHYLGHLNAMKRELTVGENLAFWRDFMGDYEGGDSVSLEDAADAVGLAGALDLPFGYLSAGQKRRLAFARLLVAHRPVWMLDEPTASLDVASKVLIEDIVNRHLAKGGIAIIATHEPLALSNCGELGFSGPVELAADPFLPEGV